MSLFGSISSVLTGNAPRFKKRKFDPEKMSIEDIILPSSMENIDSEGSRELIKNEVDVFKSLGYKDKPLDQLKVKEYHSFQIGLMMKFIKDEKIYLIPKIDEVLPSFVIRTPKRQLHSKVFEIVYRYDNGVDKEQSIEKLKNEIKWSPLDAAYLLCYINTENKWVPKGL
jgi:hypothetical protein